MKHFCTLVFITFLCTSCAAPAPEFERQDFVSRREIVANSLYQQAVASLRSGRLIDAELRMLQALYLFPDAHNIRANLALILKSNSLYEEAAKIYTDLIRLFPDVIEYRFALAENYYFQKEYSTAINNFESVMLAFEKENDNAKASLTARTLAALNFTIGNEQQAFCYSEQALVYQGSQDQIIRHARILLAIGYYKDAQNILSPLLQSLAELRDPAVLKLGAIIHYANLEFEEARKLLQLALDYQGADTKEPELETIRRVFSHKFPEDVSSEDEEVQEEVKLVFNEQLTLYWPHNLLQDYYDYKESLNSK